MPLDLVHDIQHSYRLLVRATTFPGTIVDLSGAARCIEPVPPFNAAILLLAHVLLDSEVRFGVSSNDRERDERIIRERTFARPASLDQGRYIFVLGTDRDPTPAIRAATEGTLADPHLGATVCIEVRNLSQGAAAREGAARSSQTDRVSDESGRSPASAIRLTGPGIQAERELLVDSPFPWVAARNERTAEYPQGIDLYLVDSTGSLVALPRTTTIREQGTT